MCQYPLKTILGLAADCWCVFGINPVVGQSLFFEHLSQWHDDHDVIISTISFQRSETLEQCTRSKLANRSLNKICTWHQPLHSYKCLQSAVTNVYIVIIHQHWGTWPKPRKQICFLNFILFGPTNSQPHRKSLFGRTYPYHQLKGWKPGWMENARGYGHPIDIVHGNLRVPPQCHPSREIRPRF